MCIQKGMTAVYIASYNGYDQLLELLLRRKPDVNLPTEVRFLYVTYLPYQHALHYTAIYRAVYNLPLSYSSTNRLKFLILCTSWQACGSKILVL